MTSRSNADGAAGRSSLSSSTSSGSTARW